MKKIREIFIKCKELINYGIFGVLTTVINYISYIVFTRLFGIDIFISNSLAWILSVIFAFITNKLIVFESKKFTFKVIIKEGISFAVARILSLILDMLILYIMTDLMGISDLIVRIISNIVVIIVNYILSKFITFKNK